MEGVAVPEKIHLIANEMEEMETEMDAIEIATVEKTIRTPVEE